MTEENPEFIDETDEPDLEMPEDGRDSQPPAKGSSDDPESLEGEDPLRNTDAVLTNPTDGTTLTGQEAEQPKEDDWALEEERVVDEDELDEQLDQDLE